MVAAIVRDASFWVFSWSVVAFLQVLALTPVHRKPSPVFRPTVSYRPAIS
jgi:hypothetical protein